MSIQKILETNLTNKDVKIALLNNQKYNLYKAKARINAELDKIIRELNRLRNE